MTLSYVATPSSLGVPAPLQSRRDRVRSGAIHVFLLFGSVFYVVPFFWMLTTSLKGSGRELTMPPEWIPDPIVWGNYAKALTVVPMLQFAQNTLVITATATVVGVLMSSLAGFAFARLRFPGRDQLFSLCLASLMLPGMVTLIPEFLVFKQLSMIDTFVPLIVPWSLGGSAFAVFLFRQYALTVPLELDEAARVDGAGAFRIWWTIILPLMRPALATATILSVIHHWNDFLRPLVYLHTPAKRTLAIGIALFKSEYLVEWNLMMAAATCMLIPIMILFFVAQRYFVQGIVMSGIKG